MESTQLNNATPTPKKATTNKESVKVISVQYQKELNLIMVRGSSIEDYSTHKYEVLSDDINHHFRLNHSLHLYFNYDYMDLKAVEFLKPIFESLETYHKKGKAVKVFWSCLNAAENARDFGSQLKSQSSFGFHL